MPNNDHLVLISGKSTTGKSASLRELKDPEEVVYLNCEVNKKLPFKSKFDEKNVTDPLQVYEALEHYEDKSVHTLVIDSLTYLMDMYETQYVLTSPDGRKAWGNYAQYLKKLMFNYVAGSSKNFIFLAHTNDILNESELAIDTMVKVKGSLMNNGIESFFSTVISTKRMPVKKLEPYKNSLLVITDEEKALGYKYVYQTRLTKETINERIRSALGMWTREETYIDNNAQHVMDRLHEYYD